MEEARQVFFLEDSVERFCCGAAVGRACNGNGGTFDASPVESDGNFGKGAKFAEAIHSGKL